MPLRIDGGGGPIPPFACSVSVEGESEAGMQAGGDASSSADPGPVPVRRARLGQSTVTMAGLVPSLPGHVATMVEGMAGSGDPDDTDTIFGGSCSPRNTRTLLGHSSPSSQSTRRKRLAN